MNSNILGAKNVAETSRKEMDWMYKGFVKGMVIGGLVGASVSMMMNSDMMSSKTGRKMMRRGKSLIRKTGNIIEDVADLFR
jgi:gas vesicle protein